MTIVVVGGTGLIGSKLVKRLRGNGQEVIPASPSTGIDTTAGACLAGALASVEVVVDVENSAFIRGQCCPEVFQDGRPQSDDGGSSRRRETSCRTLDRRRRPLSRDRVFPRAKLTEERASSRFREFRTRLYGQRNSSTSWDTLRKGAPAANQFMCHRVLPWSRKQNANSELLHNGH